MTTIHSGSLSLSASTRGEVPSSEPTSRAVHMPYLDFSVELVAFVSLSSVLDSRRVRGSVERAGCAPAPPPVRPRRVCSRSRCGSGGTRTRGSQESKLRCVLCGDTGQLSAVSDQCTV